MVLTILYALFLDVRKDVFSAIESNFRDAKVLKGQPNHVIGTTLIQEILKNKKIHLRRFIELVNDDEKSEQLLQANIFSYNLANNMIKFQSRATEAFVKEHPELFKAETK